MFLQFRKGVVSFLANRAAMHFPKCISAENLKQKKNIDEIGTQISMSTDHDQKNCKAIFCRTFDRQI